MGWMSNLECWQLVLHLQPQNQALQQMWTVEAPALWAGLSALHVTAGCGHDEAYIVAALAVANRRTG